MLSSARSEFIPIHRSDYDPAMVLSRHRYSYADGEAQGDQPCRQLDPGEDTFSIRGSEQLSWFRSIHFANVVAAYANILRFQSRTAGSLSLTEPRDTGERFPRRADTLMRTAISHDALPRAAKLFIYLLMGVLRNKPNFNLSFTLAGLRPAASESAKSPGFISAASPNKKAPAMAGASDVREAARVAACNE